MIENEWDKPWQSGNNKYFQNLGGGGRGMRITNSRPAWAISIVRLSPKQTIMHGARYVVCDM